MHPFDIRSVLLAKHAQHVVFIHFPIALFLAGVLFDFLAQATKRSAFAAAAYCNLMFAAISTIPVVISGILAWQWALEGQKLKGVLLMHLILGCFTSVTISFIWWIHRKARLGTAFMPTVHRLGIEAVAAMLVMLTGHLGGFLSGVNA